MISRLGLGDESGVESPRMLAAVALSQLRLGVGEGRRPSWRGDCRLILLLRRTLMTWACPRLLLFLLILSLSGGVGGRSFSSWTEI